MVEKKQRIIKYTQEHKLKKRIKKKEATIVNINLKRTNFINITPSTSVFICLLLFNIVQNNLENFYFTNHLLHHQNQVLAYNIDTQSAIVHHGPENSYFGYTVAQHKDRNNSWVLVGAPKAQTDQRNVKEGGAVYKCWPASSRACQQIPFDTNGPSILQLKNETKQSDEKSHQWFGASLQSATESGSIVACAPLYVYFSSSLRRRDPVGTCWVSRGSFGGFLEYSPCRLNEQWGHHHMGSCQAGFSSAITKDGSRLFMGAPGSHVWQGQAFAHNLRTDLSNSTSGVNPHSEDDSYLGYSMAVGRFSPLSPTNGVESDLAIAIPRGSDLLGKVMIVNREMKTLRNITGEQIGAYFGYSLATADINGDGFDDLLIGAPLYYNQSISHKESHFERGRVYVALQNHRHEFELHQRLDGHKNKARFGTSIANCGDLNRDGYQDIAVGAPYDGPEQRGAVYIYMGHKKGLSEEFDQVIYAEMLPRNEGNQMRSFGFSLSGGQDLDGNSYPDLVVGDYEADRAVVLRTRPVVFVNTTMTFSPDHFNLDDKKCSLPVGSSTVMVPCITIQYCTKYYGFNADNRLNFVYDIKLDTQNKGAPRLFFLNDPKSNELLNNHTTLYKDNQLCHSFKAYIARDIRDKLTPLKVDIDYNLAPDNNQIIDSSNNLIKLKPVLNKSQQLNKMSKVASIQKNCGSEGICVPDLKLTMNSNMYEYTIGSNEKLILDVTVRNDGEDAFESIFYLTMPTTINYEGYESSRKDYPICYKKPDQTEANLLTCDLGNPLVRNDVLKFNITTKPASGQFNTTDYTFIGLVNSTNPELDERHLEDNSVAVGISIKVDFDLVLSGSSSPPVVFHNSTSSQLNTADRNAKVSKPAQTVADLGEEVIHKYQLHNKGPSTINDIAVTILWTSKHEPGKCLLYLVDDPITNQKVKCKQLPAGQINPNNLKYLIGNPINTTALSATSSLNPNNYYYSSTNNMLASHNNNNNNNNQYSSNSRAQQRFKRQTTTSNNNDNKKSDMEMTTVDKSIIKEQSNLLNCDESRCTRFECNVIDLASNDFATIEIRSRLCKETLDYLSRKDNDISSKLIAQIKSLPYNVSTAYIAPYVKVVKTQVITSGLAVKDLLPWWLIFLSILLGILLFILLACFLNYLGFFARKRPPKNTEREPLTPTVWNDYQYTPGDTAL